MLLAACQTPKSDRLLGGEKKAAVKKEPTEKQKAHQQKMKDCSKRAGDMKMKGDDRKRFMSACLKG